MEHRYFASTSSNDERKERNDVSTINKIRNSFADINKNNNKSYHNGKTNVYPYESNNIISFHNK